MNAVCSELGPIEQNTQTTKPLTTSEHGKAMRDVNTKGNWASSDKIAGRRFMFSEEKIIHTCI